LRFASTKNTDEGIEVADRCTIVGNACDSKGETGQGAGVYILGQGNGVEDIHLGFNRYGILCGSGGDNFIVKNTARSNFNNLSSDKAAPVISNPGASNFSTMTPWSNVAC